VNAGRRDEADAMEKQSVRVADGAGDDGNNEDTVIGDMKQTEE
jgi:hypothetical protein